LYEKIFLAVRRVSKDCDEHGKGTNRKAEISAKINLHYKSPPQAVTVAEVVTAIPPRKSSRVCDRNDNDRKNVT
jgi:hypothetical protein